MKADPEHAPEYLALAAVERFGPEARDWLAKNPGTDVQAIQKRFVRLSQASGAAAGVTGAVGAVLDIGVLAWNQARMVLYLAAALGQDPTQPDRAAEMLILRGLQTKLDAARTAIDVARRKQPVKGNLPTKQVYATLAWQLARMAGLAAAKRLALMVVPIAGAPLGALTNGSATKKLAKDAIKYYTERKPAAITQADG
jgi:hypothetical protein